MPKQKRHPTKYVGVKYVVGTVPGTNKPEKIFYIYYRKNGKFIEEKAGRESRDEMTAARANNIRGMKIEGVLPSNKEQREAEKAAKLAQSKNWTIDKLWKKYKEGRKPGKSLNTDKGRYKTYIEPVFGKKNPREIIPLDVDRLRINLLKKKSPQTVKHVLNLLTWIINYGVKSGCCAGLPFKIKKPVVNNEKTEDLTSDQLSSLLEAINKDKHPQAGPIMLMALYTGMRRGELFKLKWEHVNFDRGFVLIKDPKGGLDQKIPINNAARNLLENHIGSDSEYVFPGRNGGQRVDIHKHARKIADMAGLPKGFRPLHGLRHVFASTLASSGQVDLYTLQRLLTHKSPLMTQRYAHLRDEVLKKASNVASDLFTIEIKKAEKTTQVSNK